MTCFLKSGIPYLKERMKKTLLEKVENQFPTLIVANGRLSLGNQQRKGNEMQQLDLTGLHELVDHSWPDRLDLVARVFKFKLDALVKEI